MTFFIPRRSIYNYPHDYTNLFYFDHRRPCFTPDGALLITPTGIYRSFPTKETNLKNVNDKDEEISYYQEMKRSFCTHLFTRYVVLLLFYSCSAFFIFYTLVIYSPLWIIFRTAAFLAPLYRKLSEFVFD
jgi:hypothetical protein